MSGVGSEENRASFFLFFKIPGFGQAIEFFLDRVGGDGEFRGQLPEIAGDVGVEKELEEELDSCLGCEELRKHGCSVQFF
jgi:hypothetical protein